MNLRCFQFALSIALTGFLTLTGNSQSIQSPDDFLPHQIGDQFTHHHQLVDYYQYVSENSDWVNLMEYGRTNEDRPLLMAFVSTPGNLERLEEIRLNNLRRTGMESGTPVEEDIAIVWLSFNVHGNESAGSESSMPVLYNLITSDAAKSWLENTVVILDPCINPDGYSRYTDWNRRYANRILNPNIQAVEHNEPWPGGRSNHYLFDLNRDWAWQTQIESRQRLPQYLDWLPHVHVDFHEMGYRSPYFFAPAAQPYHEAVTSWQKEFQKTIGQNHAKYFGQNGWLFYTREVFDLLYPSYGDTYPTYHGAIGMTYEQGGSGTASRGILLPTGDTLFLHDRVAHHVTTALSTVEISYLNRSRLITEFQKYYQVSSQPASNSHQAYLLRCDQEEKLQSFMELLDRNRIRYFHPATNSQVGATDIVDNSAIKTSLRPQDVIIPLNQPFGGFIDILMEAEPTLVDSLTYDITAWSLPMAYGLKGYLLPSVPATQPVDHSSQGVGKLDPAYAYAISWGSTKAAKSVAYLASQGVSMRLATQPFAVEGKTYPAGTVLVLKGDNRRLGNELIEHLNSVNQMNASITSITNSWMDSGPDFGSNQMRRLQIPKVASLMGDGTSSLSVGQLWYHMEQELEYPITFIWTDDFDRADLSEFNVLVVPEGFYRWSEGTKKKIEDWVREGGKLVSMGSAARAVAELNGSGLESIDQGEEDTTEIAYEDRIRESLKEDIPGIVIRTTLDPSHPLTFGLSNPYFSLKTGGRLFKPLDEGWNPIKVESMPTYFGFAGSKVKKHLPNSLIVGEKNVGRGSMVYLLDNPLFRAFWNEGKQLFDNALFF